MSQKVIIALVTVIILLAGIGVTVYLVRQRQQVRQQAAVPEGEATVSISPQSATHRVNESFTATVFFNTDNVVIEALALRLTYPYSGTEPELSVESIDISPTFLASGDWTCPVKTANPVNGTVNIDIACLNTSIEGFATSTNTELATIKFIARKVPLTNPVVIKFDKNESIITKKIDAQDTLLIPTSTGTYTITEAGSQTPTATPTQAVGGQPAPTNTPAPAAAATPTSPPPPPTSQPIPPTEAPVPPTKAPVPVSGHSLPTVILGIAGALLLILGIMIG